MTSSTLLGHVPRNVADSAGVAGLQRKGLYVLAAVPFLVAVELLDVPLVLLGSLQDLVLANTSPDSNRFAPLVTWMNLLNGGGCIALSVAAALLAIATAQTLAPYLHTPASKQNLGSAV